MARTVYERYGGFANIRKIVSAFYDKVLDSERLHGFFENSDMRSLIDHQTQFIAALMGGPASFGDDVLRRVHQRIGIQRADFAESALLLRETLEDFEMEPEDIQLVCREFARREHCIVAT